MLSVIQLIDGWLDEMLLAIKFNVASDGCSVRLKGLAQLFIACRGRKGRVQRFRRLRRTTVRSCLSTRNTKTGDHEKLEPRDR